MKNVASFEKKCGKIWKNQDCRNPFFYEKEDTLPIKCSRKTMLALSSGKGSDPGKHFNGKRNLPIK